jgi:hypothetical protein
LHLNLYSAPDETPCVSDIPEATRERFWATARSYRNDGITRGKAWKKLNEVDDFRRVVAAHDLTADKLYKRLFRKDGVVGTGSHLQADVQRYATSVWAAWAGD